MTLQTLALVVVATALVAAQEPPPKPLSPTGTAATQVQGKYVKLAGRGAFALGGANYEGGKWIEITCGRPLKRGRDLWGSGANYGKDALVVSEVTLLRSTIAFPGDPLDTSVALNPCASASVMTKTATTIAMPPAVMAAVALRTVIDRKL